MAAIAFIAFMALAIVGVENSQPLLERLLFHSPTMAKAMKAMKAMAAMKAMRVMKKKAVSKIAKGKLAKLVVFRGNKAKTTGGLSKSELIKNKHGRVVSKKQSANGKKAYANIKGWTVAVQKARKALGVKGFVAVKKGTPLYKKAKELFQ